MNSTDQPAIEHSRILALNSARASLPLGRAFPPPDEELEPTERVFNRFLP